MLSKDKIERARNELEKNRLTPQERKILKAMTPSQRFQVASSLYRTARHLKAAGFRSAHPDWSEQQIESAVRDVFLYGNDSEFEGLMYRTSPLAPPLTQE